MEVAVREEVTPQFLRAESEMEQAAAPQICVELYEQIVKLRPDWHSQADDAGVLRVGMTGSAADGPEWQQHIRDKRRREGLGKRFKRAGDPFCAEPGGGIVGKLGSSVSNATPANSHSPDTSRLERSRCGGGRIRVRLSRPLWLPG